MQCRWLALDSTRHDSSNAHEQCDKALKVAIVLATMLRRQFFEVVIVSRCLPTHGAEMQEIVIRVAPLPSGDSKALAQIGAYAES